MVNNNTVKDIVSSLKVTPKVKNNTYQAEVTRIDNEGIVYVTIAGSNQETPTELTASEVKKGDAVTVEWRNNKLYIGGNYSNPSAGVQRVYVVESVANNAQSTAETAMRDATIAHDAAVSATESAATAGRAASTAQAAAEAAVEVANTKKTVFITQPTPPYHVGDLWAKLGEELVDLIDSADNNIVDDQGALFQAALLSDATVYVCTNPKLEGQAFDDSDWNLATADTGLREWFWHDALGAHILGDESGFRNDIDSTGMRIMDTETETSVAEFTASSAQVGASSSFNVVTGSNKISFNNNGSKLAEMESDGMTWYNGSQNDMVSLKTAISGNTKVAMLKSGKPEILLVDDSNNYSNIRIEQYIQTSDNNQDYRYTGGAELRSFDFIVGTDKYAIDGSSEDYVRFETGVQTNSGNALNVSRTVNGSSTTNLLSLNKSGQLTVGGHSSSIGTILQNAWKISSSSSSGTACTDTISLTAGTWMLGMITPTCSATIAYYFTNLSSTLSYPYFNLGTGGSGWVPVTISSTTNVAIATGASTSVSYSNTARGRILAVRIA